MTSEQSGAPDFAALFAALPVAVLVIDPDHRVAHANAESEALLNVSERAMLGRPLDSVFRPPVPLKGREDRAIAAFDVEVPLTRGGTLRVDYLETLLAEHDGWRTIALHHDAGARPVGNAADRGRRGAIGAAAMLAHEIKNPLSGIRGAAQLLAADTEANRALTSLITTEVDRIAALIDGMQGFTDTRPLELVPTNIYPLLDHARQLARSGFAREVRIGERFDPSLPSVQIDRDAMLQVLINLLKNAAEATRGEQEPHITLTTAYRHGMAVSPAPGRARQPLPIEICVIDNGPGAPPEIADHLFEAFVSSKRDGQGLGLALVDKLVRDMSGVVQYAREGTPPATVLRMLLPRGAA